MRKKSLLTVLALAAILGIITIVSCDKATVDSNTTTATDNSLCEEEFFRVVPMVTSLCAGSLTPGVRRVEGGPHYPVITVTDTATNPGWPRTLTINYGPGVVDSSDGRTRSGIVTVSFPNYWHDLGTQATVAYSGYFVNNIAYSATINITHNSDSGFTESIGAGKCTPSGVKNPILYNGSVVLTWTQGESSPTVAAANSYSISGTLSGTDRNQVNYTTSITKSLIKPSSCTYITEGTEIITPAGLTTRTVDYGSGSCDNQANVTIDGNSFAITLQ